MNITDLKLGDIVCKKYDSFPMVVVGLYSTLDFEGNEGDMWEVSVEDLELVKEI